mmetsp:Transcript_26769/g.77289  ORF Transcript_26769/g.77289 Transcript_26769/m.77289 type:complete len:237 (+) Transcript_26769:529-1239(+)
MTAEEAATRIAAPTMRIATASESASAIEVGIVDGTTVVGTTARETTAAETTAAGMTGAETTVAETVLAGMNGVAAVAMAIAADATTGRVPVIGTPIASVTVVIEIMIETAIAESGSMMTGTATEIAAATANGKETGEGMIVIGAANGPWRTNCAESARAAMIVTIMAETGGNKIVPTRYWLTPPPPELLPMRSRNDGESPSGILATAWMAFPTGCGTNLSNRSHHPSRGWGRAKGQ